MRIVRRVLRPVLAAMLALGPFVLPASAKILIEIDKSAQRMTVSQDGAQLYTWPVSTGLRSYDTPGGAFTPFRMEKEHYSREWDDAPMPHSIFFTQKGHAIHGTEHIRNIGRPASHGCVRLETENARVLFDLVKREGMANTRVVLAGETPAPVETPAPAVARRNRPAYIAPDYDDDMPQRRARVYQRVEPYTWGQPGYSSRVYERERAYQPAPYRRVFGGY